MNDPIYKTGDVVECSFIDNVPIVSSLNLWSRRKISFKVGLVIKFKYNDKFYYPNRYKVLFGDKQIWIPEGWLKEYKKNE